MSNKLPWKQDFINNLIWYVIFNVLNVWIGKPMFTGKNISGIRTIFYFISGFMLFGGWIAVTKLIAEKTNWLIAILITLPSSLILNFFIIQLFLI